MDTQYIYGKKTYNENPSLKCFLNVRYDIHHKCQLQKETYFLFSTKEYFHFLLFLVEP